MGGEQPYPSCQPDLDDESVFGESRMEWGNVSVGIHLENPKPHCHAEAIPAFASVQSFCLKLLERPHLEDCTPDSKSVVLVV